MDGRFAPGDSDLIGSLTRTLTRRIILLAAACFLGAGGVLLGHGSPAVGAARPALSCALTCTPIKHIIVIVRENHSFDNLFGRFPGADGARTARVCPLPDT